MTQQQLLKIVNRINRKIYFRKEHKSIYLLNHKISILQLLQKSGGRVQTNRRMIALNTFVEGTHVTRKTQSEISWQ